MNHTVKVLAVVNENSNVKHIVVQKPEGCDFHPGQFMQVSSKVGLNSPLYITSFSNDPNIEFYLNVSDKDKKEISGIKPGEEIVLGDVDGKIEYKGPGYFIAEGSGITSFIPIFRQLKEEENSFTNSFLIVSTPSSRDVIMENDLRKMFGSRCIFNLENEERSGFDHHGLTKEFFQEVILNPNKHCYICGSKAMVENTKAILENLGVNPKMIIWESCN